MCNLSVHSPNVIRRVRHSVKAPEKPLTGGLQSRENSVYSGHTMADGEQTGGGQTSNGNALDGVQTQAAVMVAPTAPAEGQSPAGAPAAVEIAAAVVTPPPGEAPPIQVLARPMPMRPNPGPMMPVSGDVGPGLPPGAVRLKPEEKARMMTLHKRLGEHKARLAQLHLDVELRKAKAARDPGSHLEQLGNTLFEYEQRKADILMEIHRQVAFFQDATSELAMAHGLSGERGQVVCDIVRGVLLPKSVA